MMFPDDEATRRTERIMAGWLRRVEQRKEQRPTTAVYNAAYESVREELALILPQATAHQPGKDQA